MNQYMVVKNQQVAIEANDPDEAMKKVLHGEGIAAGGSINATLRPPNPTVSLAGPGVVPGGKSHA